MRLISEQKALERLKRLRSDLKTQIAETYEHRAKSCLTCETPGACCLDAHFVNVHISRLEAVAIKQTLDSLPIEERNNVYDRIDATIAKYGLKPNGDTFDQTYACPLFEKGTGCLVHNTGKPVACTMHACYENKADLPPSELQVKQELLIDRLNDRTYARSQPLLPIPVAIQRGR